MSEPEEPRGLPPGAEPDPGHLLPPEDWRRVVEEAEREARRIEREQPPGYGQGAAAGRFGTGALPVDGAVSAPSNGGRRPGAPTFAVLHSAETPLRAGYAAAIARYFAGGPGTSCHYMVDPAETWGVLDDGLIAWHCGNGNPRSIGVEQAGYAAYSRAQWLAVDGRRQLTRVAALMRAIRDRHGIEPRFVSDDELRACHAGRIVGGWATHDQCRRVLGGTVHTDPMPNYPLDELVRLATDEGDDMPSAQEVAEAVWAHRLSGLSVPTAAGTVLTDARSIARRGEVAVLALQRALAAQGAVVTPAQLSAALAEVQAELDDEPATR